METTTPKFWRLVILALLNFAHQITCATGGTDNDYNNVCSTNGDIMARNSSGFIISGENINGDKQSFSQDCRRAIVVDDGYIIELKLEKLEGTGVVKVYDGGHNNMKKLHTFSKDTLHFAFNTTGNVALIRFITDEEAGSLFLMSFRAVRVFGTFPVCKCPAVHNGTMDCRNDIITAEGLSKKNCNFSCDEGYKNPALSTGSVGHISCNMHENEWTPRDITPLLNEYSCIKPTVPSGVEKTLTFQYQNASCSQLGNQSLGMINSVITNYLVINVTDVSMQGYCFQTKDKPTDCSLERVKVVCISEPNKTASIRVTVRDNPTNINDDIWEATEKLYASFQKLNLGQLGILGRFDVHEDGYTFPISKSPIQSSVDCLCPVGLDNFCKFGSLYCGTCPSNMYYDPVYRKCLQCDPTNPNDCNPGERKQSPASLEHCSTFCPAGRGFSNVTGLCTWCPKNTYSDSSSSNKQSCLKCPEGKVTPVYGASNVLECILPCSQGEYVKKDMDKPGICTKCPIGSYMDENNHVHQFCKLCNNDTITLQNGSSTNTQCVEKCTTGQHYDNDHKSCVACSNNTYQDEEGKATCKTCQINEGTLKSGATSKGECKVFCTFGQLFVPDANLGFGSCELCPVNSYQDKDAHLQTECTPCPEFMKTIGGSHNLSDCSYPACSQGKFFDLAENECKKCEKGSFQNKTGQLECVRCEEGKTTLDEGAISVMDCIRHCDEGTFLDTSNKTCINCPVGTYQEKEMHTEIECAKCPSMTTTLEGGAKNASSCAGLCQLKNEPCMYESKCINQEDGYSCECRPGLIGGNCEKIVEQDKTQSVNIKLQITALEWKDAMQDSNSNEYKTTAKQIEASITEELKEDASFRIAIVKTLSKGSVIAETELVYVPDGKLNSPVQNLYTKVTADGKVGSLAANSSSLKVVSQSCQGSLGMENGHIKNTQITGTQGVPGYPPHEARLNSEKGWHAEDERDEYFLQVDLGEIMIVSGISTQGKSLDSYVTSYRLEYSDNGTSWTKYKEENKEKTFNGTSDKDTVQTNILLTHITGQFIKVVPVTWTGCVCMRLEILGCRPNDALLLPPSTPVPTTDLPTLNITTSGPSFSQPTAVPSVQMLNIVLACIGAFLIVVLCSVVCYCFQTRQLGRSRGHKPMQKVHEVVDVEEGDGTTYAALDEKVEDGDAETAM